MFVNDDPNLTYLGTQDGRDHYIDEQSGDMVQRFGNDPEAYISWPIDDIYALSESAQQKWTVTIDLLYQHN
jgi:hypothetical protein